MQRLTFLLALVPLAAATPADAQTAPTSEIDADWVEGFVAVGPAVTPEFEGSDSYRLSPFVAASLHIEDISIDLRGLTLRASFEPLPNIVAGPVLNIRQSRDDDVGGRVALLNEIDTAVEAGGFVGLRIGGDQKGQGEISLDLTALADVSNTHDGYLVSLNAGYAVIRNENFSFSLDAEATYGNKDYQRTYFGVTPEEATISGLAAYSPGSSLRDIGAGATIGYQFDSRWGLIGRLAYSYLVGDAADSPIVREEGSRSQIVAGAALSYRF